MKNRHLFIVMAVVFAVFMASDVNGQYPQSTVGSPTLPPSTAGGSLIANPRGYGNAGNLVITGNVPGGRHFRGVVPYSSYAEFSGPLGSDSLNSFIRSSAGRSYPEYGTGHTEAYYLPSRTVTVMERDGQSGLVPPQVTFRGGTGRFAPPVSQPIFGTDSLYREQRPLSSNITELERLLKEQLGLEEFKPTFQKEFEFSKSYLDEVETPAPDLKAPADDIFSEAKRRLDERITDESLQPQAPDEPSVPLTLAQQRRQAKEQLQKKKEKPTDTLDQMQRDLFDHLKVEDPLEQRDGQTTDETEISEELGDKSTPEGEEREVGKLKIPELEIPKLQIPEREELPEVSHEKAVEIRGQYKTHEEFAQARFTQYIEAAKQFMEDKKFYRAADTYSLAETWQPKNYISYAGRAFALMGAGEYMSSSYFLQKAIVLSPQFAQQKTALTDLLDDRDLIEDRIIEIAKWGRQSKAPELAFLAAYVYRQTNRHTEAAGSINFAAEEMGENPAVIILKEVIDSGN